MTRWQSPPEGHGWLTDEIRQALMAIRGRHAAKKRTTLIKVAFARADPTRRVSDVFGQPDTCSEAIWYQKWQYRPEIQAALALCEARVLEWRDAQTTALLAHYKDQREREIAEESLTAVKGLALTAVNTSDRADYRTDAAMKLLALADPQLVAHVHNKGQPLAIQIENLDEFLEQELARVSGVESDAETECQSASLDDDDGAGPDTGD